MPVFFGACRGGRSLTTLASFVSIAVDTAPSTGIARSFGQRPLERIGNLFQNFAQATEVFAQ